MTENELEDLAKDVDHMLATWTVHYDIPALELSAIVLARLHYLNLAFESWDDYVTLLERQRAILKRDYLTANIMIDNILNANN